MGNNRTEAVLWAAALVVTIATILRLQQAPPVVPALGRFEASGGEIRRDRPSDSLAQVVVDGNPFRLERRPASVPFSMTRERPASETVAPRMSPPNLALIGILGPPWRAVLTGVPGQSGTSIVQSGDSFSQLQVERITSDTVVVRGFDTTWTLTVRLPWR